MPQEQKPPPSWEMQNGVAEDIISQAQKDILYTMKFLGESQHKMTTHFNNFIEAELNRVGINREEYPFLQVFIDSHSAKLREFVFAGVSLTRQFRIQEIEELLGDTTKVFRSDIWDALSKNIKMAEEQFHSQVKDFPEFMEKMKTEISGKVTYDTRSR